MKKEVIYQELKQKIENKNNIVLSVHDLSNLYIVCGEITQQFNEMLDDEVDSFISVFLTKDKK
jgi:hypothetical protein